MTTPHFITDHTAKGVLRSVVRRMAEQTPDKDVLIAKIHNIVRGSRTELQALNRVRAALEPYCCRDHVTKRKEGSKTFYSLSGRIVRFEQTELGWELSIDSMQISFLCHHSIVNYTSGYLVYTGHALERLFQRAAVIEPQKVIDEIVASQRYQNIWSCGIETGVPIKRVVLPTSTGSFIAVVQPREQQELSYLDGRRTQSEKVEDRYCYRICAKTYLPDGDNRHTIVKNKLHDLAYGITPSYVGAPTLEMVNSVVLPMQVAAIKRLIEGEPWLTEPLEA